MKKMIVTLSDYDGNHYKFEMAVEDARNCDHSGDCYNDCVEVAQLEYMQAQLSKLSEEQIKNILDNYGTPYECNDTRNELEVCLVWVIAGEVECQSWGIIEKS